MTARRLRVLVMTSTFPRWQGDAEPPFVYNLSARLAQKFDVTVLAPHGPRCKVAEQWDGLRVIRFRYFWPERLERLAYGGILPNLKRNKLLWLLVPFFFIAEFIAALRDARSQRFDVLHAHWVIPQGIVAVLVGWICRTPVLMTCHAADVYGLRGPFQNRVKRWTLNRCAYITAVSHHLLQAVRDLRVDRQIRTAVISMGVDMVHFNPLKRDEPLRHRLAGQGPLLLFVGRLVEKKGVKFLLEAMPAVLQDFPDTTLVVVGDGPLRGELEALAESLQIDDHVHYVGAVPQAGLPAYYATADVFVGSSIVAESGDTEGLPITFMEALASGCPVVSSDVGGASEIIVHDRAGLLVPERNPAAIADGIRKLLSDRPLRDRLCDAGLHWVKERFDQQAVAEKYAAIILRVGTAA